MKSALIILCCVPFIYAQTLDKLQAQSARGVDRAQNLKGFIFKKAPEIENLKVRAVPPPAIASTDSAKAVVPSHHGSGVLSYRVDVMENSLKEQNSNITEIKNAQLQMTAILDNLQKQSDSHTSNQNTLTKIIEIIIGSFTTIMVAYLGLKLKKKV